MKTKNTKINISDFIKRVRIGHKKPKSFSADKLLNFAKRHAGKKGPDDLSSKHDKYLYGER